MPENGLSARFVFPPNVSHTFGAEQKSHFSPFLPPSPGNRKEKEAAAFFSSKWSMGDSNP